jgi:hypothetical protein
MRIPSGATAAIALGAVALGCGGKGAGADSQLSVQGELAQRQYEEIQTAVSGGNAVEQEFNCAFLMAMIEGHEETAADRELSGRAKQLCYGEIHKAMYQQTVEDVSHRADKGAIPFMECVPAQAALADGDKEVDVPGLTDARERAVELCKRAWDE